MFQAGLEPAADIINYLCVCVYSSALDNPDWYRINNFLLSHKFLHQTLKLCLVFVVILIRSLCGLQ